MTCLYCGASLFVSGRRAWCDKPYEQGGCGAFYRVESQGLRLVPELSGPTYLQPWSEWSKQWPVKP